MLNKNKAPKITNPPNQNGGRVEALVICAYYKLTETKYLSTIIIHLLIPSFTALS
jgi:hypothetical protein